VVEELRAAGHRVAVAGDGVNDGPALAAADLAIAMGRSGTDIALSLSGATLVDDRIDRLPDLLDHGRRTVSVIRGNVWAAMSINAGGVVLGALGLIGPIVGALIHNLSSFAVVVNSARLAWRRSDSRKA
jgi:P-type E1-E2 ATPase